MIRRGLVVGGALALVVGTYSWGFSFFKGHYVPGTMLSGVDASMMDEGSLVAAVEGRLATLELTLANGDFELTIAGADVDLESDAKGDAHNLMLCQDFSSWPALVLAGGKRDAGSVSFDEKKLRKLVDAAVKDYNKAARAPVAATLVRESDKAPFTIEPEREGTRLSADAVFERAREGLSSALSSVRLTDEDLVQPAHRATDDETVAALERANATLAGKVALTLDGTEVSSLKGSELSGWLTVVDDLRLAVDPEPAAAWADEYLWRKVDSADDGAVHTLDVEAFAAALSEAVGDGDESVEVPVVQHERFLPGGGSLASVAWEPERGRYIDVDKATQVACLFDDEGRVLWESVVTTGNEASRDGTPAGEFEIYERVRDTVLIGEDRDYDGKPDYEHHVDYWMPFNGVIGLHDADWRDRFGGREYLEHGSGGCVNLPTESAAALFKMTHVGETVIVHD